MSSSIKNLATASILLLLASATNAHMIMKSPVPYGKSSLNNSPLLADGSDFPCKQRAGVYDAEGAQNIAAIGEPQTLSFTGSAVHGGGSCQVSLTTDLQPTKDSKWMVIKSIEGGCPANVPGNLPADPNGDGASTFQFTVPDGIAPGDYTLAWSWLNKVGNREYYMNCAPFTVTASKKAKREEAAEPAKTPQMSKRQNSFPDLYICNLASINDCVTPEGFDYEYPNPGAYVQKAGAGPYTLLPGSGGSGNNPAPSQVPSSSPEETSQPSAQPSSPSGLPIASSQPVPPQSAPPAGSYPVPTTFATATSRPASPGIFVPVTSAAAAGSASQQAPEAAPTTPTQQPAPETSGSEPGTQSGPCSVEGQWSCSADGSSFQRCSSGQWSVTMEMAAGMKCTPGLSTDLGMTAGRLRRHMSFMKKI
ncbi:hypothetical protein PV08_01728 [Exophiala spinifera]|uniref:Chitin-binding type-4 domain-containing protein n=1 Tax=Exophiala spinifera TaxID=91928 RepID=A0A0D2BQC0_9EURO|nr:uncharacterized protein PV08_01728 [Exophiala spinifera]KIW21148.1 hypothetical protein PV08_01728 [Exophiala spinifera]